MQRLALTLLCLVVGATATHETEKRIVGGGPAEHHSHPYIASLRKTHSGHHFCGGTIISRSWILTAAHCVKFKRPLDIYVVVGAISRHGHGSPNQYEQTINVTGIICHENYFHGGNYPNDIALLKLDRAIDTGKSKNVEVAKLAPEGLDVIDTACVMSGWGLMNGLDWRSRASHLQDVKITAISNEECNKRLGARVPNVIDDQICAFDRNHTVPCIEDSGGPMMCGPNHKYLTGVTSWVLGDCLTTKPSVYTRVSSYLDWIKAKSGVEAYTPFELYLCKLYNLNNSDCHQYLQLING